MHRFISRVLILLVLCSALCMSSSGQSQANLPTIIPASPEAENFKIYGEYPPATNTGVPDIKIPLYTLRYGDIEVPIMLKYHIGSAKPNPYGVELSNIGYGWVLEAGGMVSRTIYNRQDEMGPRLSPEITSLTYNENVEADYWALWDISRNHVDSEYDIFNYNFLGNGGEFVISDWASKEVVTFPDKPYKFDFATTQYTYNNLLSSVFITDDNGYKYSFSDVEYEQVNLGWFLSRIQSPSNRQVDFVYADRLISAHYGDFREVFSVTDYYMAYNPQQNPVPNQPVTNEGTVYTRYNSYTKTIKEINAPGCRVVFELNSDNSLIKSFTVFEGENILKKIVFDQSNFGQNEYVKLEGVSVRDSADKEIQHYGFQYNSTNILNSRNTDYWGWYNGVQSQYYFPQFTYFYQFTNSSWQPSDLTARTFGGNDRCVDPSNILAQTLERITYPTGGSTQFIFEPHQYIGPDCNNNSIATGGGLRIKSIINYDGPDIVSTKTYEYSPGNVRFNRFDPLHYVRYSYSFSATPNIDPVDNLPKAPTIMFNRSRTFNEELNGEIIDYYIFYPVITEYSGTVTANTGKKVYTYAYPNNHNYSAYAGVASDYLIYTSDYRGWGNGLLYKEEVFKNNGDNTYNEVQEVTNYYDHYYSAPLRCLRVYEQTDYPSTIQWYLVQISGKYTIKQFMMEPEHGITLPTPDIFGKYDYYINTGGFNLVRTVKKDFLNGPVEVVSRNYFDDGKDKYVTRSSLVENSADSLVKHFTYPYDPENTGSVYSAMVSSNRINNIVELTEERNGSTQKTKTNFRDWENNIIAPETVETSKSPGSFETRIIYGGYDANGNVRSVSKVDDINTHYIWGYNNLYPVAEIKGATQSEFDALVFNLQELEAGSSAAQNAIRNSLPGAMVTFYTYKPFIGMTSVTDVNGKKTTYEYDAFGRLEYIRDNSGKILRHLTYNYALQGGN